MANVRGYYFQFYVKNDIDSAKNVFESWIDKPHPVIDYHIAKEEQGLFDTEKHLQCFIHLKSQIRASNAKNYWRAVE